jgi:hypothetical protein
MKCCLCRKYVAEQATHEINLSGTNSKALHRVFRARSGSGVQPQVTSANAALAAAARSLPATKLPPSTGGIEHKSNAGRMALAPNGDSNAPPAAKRAFEAPAISTLVVGTGTDARVTTPSNSKMRKEQQTAAFYLTVFDSSYKEVCSSVMLFSLLVSYVSFLCYVTRPNRYTVC